MKKLLTLTFIGLLIGPWAFAQRNCHSMEHLEHLMEQDPGMQERMHAVEEHTNRFIANLGKSNNANALGANETVTIPVVVHVVYNNSTENISNAQINSQIAVLNADFSASNSDISSVPSLFSSRVGDANIQFVLADTDPSGNPSSGITRTSTTRSSFGTNNTVKFNSQGGKDAWPADQYLNLWVCDISGGILGYAQFPGGAANTDGVVCDYQYFGTNGTATAPFNLGRTATHEVGHWLNLRHIWGDGGCSVDDFVSDTPTAGNPNYGCPSFGANSCSGGDPDMWMNYMDYVDDRCMYMFSQGQVDRMRALFEPGGFRESFVNSGGGTPPNPTPTYCASQGDNSRNEWIESVQVGSIRNNSGNDGGYGEYTNSVANVTAGSNYNVTMVPGFRRRQRNQVFRIFVDWNQDGDFDDANELVGSSSPGTGNATITVSVPSSATNGNTRIRISMKRNSGASACQTFTRGEVEDYTLNISGGTRAISRDLNVQPASELAFNVYPNPTSNGATIRFDATEQGPVELIVADLRGAVVARKSWNNMNGAVEYTLAPEKLQKGLYMVVVVSNGKKQVKRLMVTQ